ncbi:MAG: hypothetical protein KDJ29_18525 [Hyphomicrobiales bacterium]|nr:hypothetical protein [Hyphomicrobiales bacterium]
MYASLKNIAIADRFLRRPPIFYGLAMKQIRAIEQSSAADRRALQAARVARTLSQARSLAGYADIPGSGVLTDWPILTKHHIQGRENDYAEKSLYPALYAQTGGTTGEPLRIKRSVPGISFEQAMVDYLCAQTGHDARSARSATLKGDVLDPAIIASGRYWYDVGSRKRVYSSLQLGPQSADAYRRSFADYAPEILFCYPSSADALVKHVGETNGIRIPLVFSSSEVLHDGIRERLRAAFQCDVVDYYGHAERLVAAWNYNGEGYRFLPSYGHVELLPNGDGLARIIATTVRSNGQVFVRYDTGDLARVGTEDPEILEQMSLGLRPFDGIVGRDSEYIDLPDGKRVFVLNHIARGVAGANSVQVHYDGASTVDLYIVPGTAFSMATCEQILRNFHDRFPSGISARLWTVAAPVREPNGKAPVLLRRPQIPQDRSQATLWFDPAPMAVDDDGAPKRSDQEAA